MTHTVNVRTINKELDSLLKRDFVTSNNVKLHIFSNILDIDSFLLDKLISLMNSTFSGTNYFVIVSPYITELKTDRINSFVDNFRIKKNFKLIQTFDKKKGEWENDWSIVLRVFKVDV